MSNLTYQNVLGDVLFYRKNAMAMTRHSFSPVYLDTCTTITSLKTLSSVRHPIFFRDAVKKIAFVLARRISLLSAGPPTLSCTFALTFSLVSMSLVFHLST